MHLLFSANHCLPKTNVAMQCEHAVKATHVCRLFLKYYLISLSYLVFKQAEDLCKQYAKATGPGTSAKPEKHLFVRKIRPILQRHLDKAERENGFM